MTRIFYLRTGIAVLCLLGSLLYGQTPLSPNLGPSLPALTHTVSAWADWDQNGTQDLFLSGYAANGQLQSFSFLQDSTGILTGIPHPFPAVHHGSAAWGDLNGDGHKDFVVLGMTSAHQSTTKIYLQDSSGGFAEIIHPLPSLAYGKVLLRDLDGDGDLDLIATGWGAQTGLYFGILEQSGVGLKKVATDQVVPRMNATLDFGDYDQDGDLDLVLGGTDPELVSHVEVYRRGTGWNFDLAPYQLPGTEQGTVQFGDIDGDSDLDLLITGATPRKLTQIYRYSPDHYALLPSNLPYCDGKGCFVDYDGDGDPDVVLVGETLDNPGHWGISQVFENVGNGQLNLLPSGMEAVVYPQIDCVDFDQDGDLDLLISGFTDNGSANTLLYLFTGLTFEP